MSARWPGPSVVDLVDELQLQQTLLKSLDEERPYATTERKEIVDTIAGLKLQLADLRGEEVADDDDGSTSSGSYSSWSDLPAMDSAKGRRVNDDFASLHSMLSPSRRSAMHRPSSAVASTTDLPMRKRQLSDPWSERDDDRLAKRPTPGIGSAQPSSPSVRRSPSKRGELLRTPQDLAAAFGLVSDGDDIEEVYEEHLKAEKALEERRDAERRQEEELYRIRNSLLGVVPRAEEDSESSDSVQVDLSSSRSVTPDFSKWFGGTSAPSPWKGSSHGSPSRSRSQPQVPTASQFTHLHRNPVITVADSDSDVAEISPAEFARKVQKLPASYANGPVIPGLRSHLHPPHRNTAMMGWNYGPRPAAPRPARERSAERMQEVMHRLRADERLTPVRTPEAMKQPLYPHQELGLAWMISMEESKYKGGILGDDMGLGKTIQTLSIILSRPSTDPERKTTLIVAPVALMHQWKREIQTKLKPGRHQLRVFVLHGVERAAKNARFDELKQYDVVLTTYGTMTSELKKREEWDKRQDEGADMRKVAKMINLPILGPNCHWYRVILDEAQQIKNHKSKCSIACARIRSEYRWCLSGTPMQNGVHELYPLLRFGRFRPYHDKKVFDKVIRKALRSNNTDSASFANGMRELRVILRAVMLRRTKTSEINGTPILQLPPKTVEEVHAVFDEEQRDFYNSLEEKIHRDYERWLASQERHRGKDGLGFVFLLLLRLRQGCCHRHLIENFARECAGAVVTEGEGNDTINFKQNAKVFGAEVVLRLKDKENEDLTCPICLDVSENPVLFFPCGHSMCPECFGAMDKGPANPDSDEAGDLKCPHCRARIDPRTITDRLTFRKVHYKEKASSGVDGVKGLDEETDSDESDDDSHDDDDGKENIDDDGDDESVDTDDEDYDTDTDKRKGKKAVRGKGKEKKRSKKDKKKKKKNKMTLSELKKEASRNQEAKRKYLERLERIWIPSAKIDKALEILDQVQDRDSTEKTIIFCSFTTLLDLLEIPIRRKGWGYVRYDGSMKTKDRTWAIEEFTDNPDCKIMLVSMKAGNSGLNLTVATQVIIFDPFWNPYVEDQAVDRAHRIGQRREVHVHRILIQNTVEDRILALQEKKRHVISQALNDKSRQNANRLTHAELRYLIGYRGQG